MKTESFVDTDVLWWCHAEALDSDAVEAVIASVNSASSCGARKQFAMILAELLIDYSEILAFGTEGL